MSQPAPSTSPFTAALQRLDARGFEQIPDPAHRQQVRAVVESGQPGVLMTLLDAQRLPAGDVLEPYVATPRPDHLEPFNARLAQELDRFGLRCPPALIRQLTYLRALTVPLDDDALAFALSRSWLAVMIVDDLCESSSESSLLMLRAGTAGASDHPPSRYCAFMLDELERFASPTFMPVFRMMFYKSFVGTLIEAHLAATGQPCGSAAGDYIRRYSGYDEYFILSAQFLGPALEYSRNLAFWTEIMPFCAHVLSDINDLLSFYKEAVHDSGAASGRLRVRAHAEGRAYPDVYRDLLRTCTDAYRRIVETAAGHDPRALAQLAHYLRGMIHWHFHCTRYRWRDLFPDLRYVA
jgi:hypothetical protein